MNQLHMVALNEGLRRKKALWRPSGRQELESFALARWASRRRQNLLDLLDQLTPKIQELTRVLEPEVEKRPMTRELTKTLTAPRCWQSDRCFSPCSRK
jgi:transposase